MVLLFGMAGEKRGKEPDGARKQSEVVRASEESSAELRVKVVPGSRREEIVGWLGERLKVKVAAPPEDGRANEALCRLVALRLGVPARSVGVVLGHTRAEKTLRIEGLTAGELALRLGEADG